ncbi:hypothetical protein VNO78_09460 [Psophocarpus tetragonolobus]|uniref:DUF7081 domain-containing protein n=1 Tax=Psophocarpus tetragonolobus TaxID=3891 RepID=A0AAN9SXI4_PSOTE
MIMVMVITSLAQFLGLAVTCPSLAVPAIASFIPLGFSFFLVVPSVFVRVCQYEKKSLENDAPIESNACKDVTNNITFDLQPVSPFSSGEGLPYAPEGWPNPGDVWSWKVGRRMNKDGYFCDRFLFLPRSLQSSTRRAGTLQSKPEVMRYLESNFPDMKIEKFFALFSWWVPSTMQTPRKAQRSLSIMPPPLKSPKTGEQTGTKRKSKEKTQIRSQPTRKSFRLVGVRPRLALDQDAIEIIDLCEGITESKEGSGTQTAGENNLNVTVDILQDKPNTDTTPSESDHGAPATTQGNNDELDKLLILAIHDIEDKIQQLDTTQGNNQEGIHKLLILAIRELDDKIQQLESKRKQMSIAIETLQRSKAKLVSSLPNV